jgi:hypothetical protein
MGVKGLTSYLQRCGAYVVVDLREQNLSRRQNNANDKITIVVDGMSLCHYIKKKEISLFHPMSFKTFAENARSFLRPFVQQEVQLIVVFDGVFEPIKNSTRTQRRADRWDLIKETLKQVSSNTVPRDPDSTSTMIYRLLLIQILNELNIQHITVPGEADQFIAKYCKTNNHFAVMANDSDYFIMGVDFIMLNTVSFPTAEQDRGITCQLYTKQKVIQALNVGEDKLALFAGLMDNDYVEEKHLNNFYSYLKILKKNSFDTIKKVIQYVQNSYDEEELFKYLGKTPYDNFLRAVSKFRLECEESEKIDVSAIGKCPKEIENRFSSGEFMVALLGILLQKENWLSLVPMMKSDVDIWRIVLPLRKKMYGMMFGSDEIVLERSSGHKPKKVKSNVSLMSGTAQVSHFSEYFNPNMSRQVKLEALLNVTTTGTVDILALHEEIPPQLFLSVVSLRYLLEVQVHWTHVHDEAKHTSTENNTNTLNNSDSSSSMSTTREDIKASEFIKAFTEREVDVLLQHLITMSRVHEINNNNVDQKHVTLPTARGLHICGVFYLCFQQMLLFNALLNCPFDFNQIKFENLFEGNQFHRALRNSKFMDERPANEEELQLHNKLKTVILSNLTKDAVFKANDDPDTQPQLTMPTKITLIGPPSLMTDLLNKEIKRLPEVQIIKHTTRQIVLQTTNELTAKHIVQFDGTVLNGLALSVELQHKSQNQK